MRFSIGDKVIVSYLKDGDHRSQYRGRCFTIASINPNSRWDENKKFDKPHYGVEETDCPYIFFENELDFAERCDFYSELKKADNVVTLRAGVVEMKVRIDDWHEEICTDALPSVTADFTILDRDVHGGYTYRIDPKNFTRAVSDLSVRDLYPNVIFGAARGNGKTNLQFEIYKRMLLGDHPTIENVIFNDPATIVFWADGSKTVVKAHDEAFDPEKGLAMAIVKKAFGNEGNYFNQLKKWLPKEESK